MIEIFVLIIFAIGIIFAFLLLLEMLLTYLILLIFYIFLGVVVGYPIYWVVKKAWQGRKQNAGNIVVSGKYSGTRGSYNSTTELAKGGYTFEISGSETQIDSTKKYRSDGFEGKYIGNIRHSEIRIEDRTMYKPPTILGEILGEKGKPIGKIDKDGTIRGSSFISDIVGGGKELGKIDSSGKIKSSSFFGLGGESTIGNVKEDSDDKSSCFLTTACIRAKNLPNNCYELNLLRGFRDKYVMFLPDGPELVREYYDMAPRIVDEIEKEDERDRVYESLFNNLVKKTINSIERGRFEEALRIYKEKVEELKCEYLK